MYSVLRDREDSIWLGLAGRGLARWRGYREWEGFTSASGLESELIYQILPRGTTAPCWPAPRPVCSRAEGRRPVDLADGTNGLEACRSTPCDWNATEACGSAPNATARRGSTPEPEEIDWFRQEQGLAGISPFALALDRSGRVWAATEKGLFVAELSTKRFRRVEEVPAVNCWAVVEAPDGAILVGTSAGLFRLSGDRWRRISTADGLRHDVVLSVAAVHTGRNLGGLLVLRQRDPDSDRRGASLHDPLWRRGGPAGRNELLPRVRCARPALGRDRSGRAGLGRRRAGFSTTTTTVSSGTIAICRGLRLNPTARCGLAPAAASRVSRQASERVRARPPVVEFIELTLGKTRVENGRYLSVGSTSNSLVTRFSALSFARESSVLFRYRLQPLFGDWRETSQPELQFPGLPPNDYRLEVQARDGSGHVGRAAGRVRLQDPASLVAHLVVSHAARLDASGRGASDRAPAARCGSSRFSGRSRRRSRRARRNWRRKRPERNARRCVPTRPTGPRASSWRT